MSDLKAEFYQLLGHLEAADLQLKSLEEIGPIEDFHDNPLWAETESEKERLRALIDRLTPRLASLREKLNA